jgi:hypothetical protein
VRDHAAVVFVSLVFVVVVVVVAAAAGAAIAPSFLFLVLLSPLHRVGPSGVWVPEIFFNDIAGPLAERR